MADNNGIINGNNGENVQNQEKTGVQKAIGAIQRGWNRFSTSNGGRWAIRCGKVALVGLGLKAAYDQGKKSVKPTTVYVTPIEENQEENQTEENPVEEGAEQPVA